MQGDLIKKWLRVDDPLRVSISDLEKFRATGVQENLYLEFKGGAIAGDQRKGIAKAISGFANSAGGLLIVGLREDKRATPPSAGELDPLTMSKEQFEQVLWGLVQPWPEKTIIVPVEVGSGQRLFLVEVPATHYPPVQETLGCAYYIRLNFENRPMPHDMVQSAFSRGLRPDLMPVVHIINHETTTSPGKRIIDLRLVLRNSGQIAATQVVTSVSTWFRGDPIRLSNLKGGFQERTEIESGGQVSILQGMAELPIYLGVGHTVGDFRLETSTDIKKVELTIMVACLECPAERYVGEVGEDETNDFMRIVADPSAARRMKRIDLRPLSTTT